jgi:hypothetical protein
MLIIGDLSDPDHIRFYRCIHLFCNLCVISWGEFWNSGRGSEGRVEKINIEELHNYYFSLHIIGLLK